MVELKLNVECKVTTIDNRILDLNPAQQQRLEEFVGDMILQDLFGVTNYLGEVEAQPLKNSKPRKVSKNAYTPIEDMKIWSLEKLAPKSRERIAQHRLVSRQIGRTKKAITQRLGELRRRYKATGSIYKSERAKQEAERSDGNIAVVNI